MTREYLIRIVATTVAALALTVTGCLLSGQFIILLDTGGTIHSTDTILDYVYVDLTENSTWKDHKDDIQAIVDLKFEAKFTNNLSAPATGELWISTNLYSTVAQVTAAGNATRVLGGLTVPGSGSVEVSFSESSKYIENLDTILNLVEGGKFYVYGIAGGVPFDVTVNGVTGQPNARLMVTFSAG